MQIYIFSYPNLLEIACNIRAFSSKTQQIAQLQNAENSTQIRDFGSKMQQITQVRDVSTKNVANSKENCPRLKKTQKKIITQSEFLVFFGNGMVSSLSSYTNKKHKKKHLHLDEFDHDLKS